MAKNSIDAYGAAGKSNLLMFDPDTLVLVVDPNHPLYDERVHLPINEAMVLNIMHQGVIEPIVVTKDPESGEVQVVVGRQRVKNAREAKARQIAKGCEPVQVPGYVRRGDGASLADIMVSENELRTDDSPLGRADKMVRLQKLGRTDEQLAVVFGCTVQTVRRTLGLLEQPAAVQKAVEQGQITLEVAGKLAKLEAPEQREKLAEVLASGAGKKGHAKSRAQRQVVDAKPKARTRREIEAILPNCHGEAAAALQWALGGTDASFAAALNSAESAA